jgi:hypothetical protein
MTLERDYKQFSSAFQSVYRKFRAREKSIAALLKREQLLLDRIDSLLKKSTPAARSTGTDKFEIIADKSRERISFD